MSLLPRITWPWRRSKTSDHTELRQASFQERRLGEWRIVASRWLQHHPTVHYVYVLLANTSTGEAQVRKGTCYHEDRPAAEVAAARCGAVLPEGPARAWFPDLMDNLTYKAN